MSKNLFMKERNHQSMFSTFRAMKVKKKDCEKFAHEKYSFWWYFYIKIFVICVDIFWRYLWMNK